MVKKLVALAGAGAVLLSVATPVLARPPKHHHKGDVDVAIVKNKAEANANTGNNSVGNWVYAVDDIKGGTTKVSGDNKLKTGEADADATAVVVANTDLSCGRGRCGKKDGKGAGETDIAKVKNKAEANANTGGNYVGNSVEAGDDIGSRCGGGTTKVSGDNTVKTGNADTDADAWVVVNTDISGGGGHPPMH